METKANYVLIGASAIIGFALALAFALWIAGADLNRSFSTVVVVFDGPVRGLARGGEVRFQGIKVGEVTDLRIDPTNPDKVLARVRIDAATPVKRDSVGQLEPVGLTGVNLIQITGGSKTAPNVRSQLGQAAPRIRGEASEIDKILGAGGDIAERTSRMLLAMQSLLSPENVAKVSAALTHLEAATAELEKQKGAVREAREAIVALRDAGRRFETAAASVETLSKNADGRLDKIGDEAATTVEEATKALTALRAAAETAQATLASTRIAADIAAEQSLPDIALAAQDLRRLSTTMETLAIQLDRSPNRLIVGAERPVVKVAP
ncbi:MAG: MlaD family protein [Caulobacterales bacterium]|jgi:phospholipid/cholesterol/gamma-HCH transport system substrate-binding protein